jgi:hypothetical protein
MAKEYGVAFAAIVRRARGGFRPSCWRAMGRTAFATGVERAAVAWPEKRASGPLGAVAGVVLAMRWTRRGGLSRKARFYWRSLGKWFSRAKTIRWEHKHPYPRSLYLKADLPQSQTVAIASAAARRWSCRPSMQWQSTSPHLLRARNRQAVANSKIPISPPNGIVQVAVSVRQAFPPYARLSPDRYKLQGDVHDCICTHSWRVRSYMSRCNRAAETI